MDIEARLARLERRNRTLQACCVLLILAFAGLALAAQTSGPANQIAARRFTLVDGKGATIGQWGEFGGKVGFSLSSAGSTRFAVGADPNGKTAMSLESPNGMTIIIGSLKDATGMNFIGKDGKLLGNVGIDEAGRFRAGLAR